MHLSATKFHLLLSRAALALVTLGAAATASAEFVRVTAANAVGNSLYDVTSFSPPPGTGSTSPLNSDGASHGSFSALVQAPNAAKGTVDVLVADASKGQIIRYTPAVGATLSSVTVVWSYKKSGPCNPDGLSLDAAGNLYIVQQNKPSVWVLPASANSATGFAAAPLLIDINGYSSLGDVVLRETMVARSAGNGFGIGDLLVLGSSKTSSNKTVLFVYRAASLQSVLSGAGARSGPDVALISVGQFTWGGGVPMGMDFWPADALDASPTVLVATAGGQVVRLDFTAGTGGYTPVLVQVFASGLGSGIFKIKEGLQLGVPYAFLTQTLPGNTGQILQLGAPTNSGTNLVGVATAGVQSPDALDVARADAVPASSCVAPLTCDLSNGVLPHSITGSTAQQVSGNVIERSCVILSDPRVHNGVCDGTSLNVANLCPGFGNETIPGTMCGASGRNGSGFALLRTDAPGVNNLPGILVYSDEDVDQILPAMAPATNPLCPSALIAWAPRSDASPSEGSIVEVDPQTGLTDLIEATGFCDASGGVNRGMSVWAVGLALNLNALSGGLPGFAQSKYNNLAATVAGANILPATKTALQASLTPVNNYLASGDYACAAAQVLTVDSQVANDPHPAVDYPGDANNFNPWGEIRGRLANLFLTLNTRILGNPANFSWPLSPADARPNCAPPAITLTATPPNIAVNGSTLITWSTQHATSCSASGGDAGWSANSGTSGSYSSPALAATASYTLACTGPGGNNSKTITVTVVPPPSIASFTASPASVPVGGTSTLTWSEGTGASCAVAGLPGASPLTTRPISQTTTYTLTCTSVGGSASASATVTAVPPPSIGSFTVSPATVAPGGSATLTWSEGTGASCAVAGLPGVSPLNTGPINKTTTYTLKCTSVGGSASASLTVTVSAPPKINYFTAQPSSIDPHSWSNCATLLWSASNVQSCKIVGGGLNRTGLGTSGSIGTGAISRTTTYTLTCTNAAGTSVTATTTITVKSRDD
jgi:hypothetical protein